MNVSIFLFSFAKIYFEMKIGLSRLVKVFSSNSKSLLKLYSRFRNVSKN